MIAALRRTAARLLALLARDRADAEARREIAAHLALLEDDYRRRGLTAAAAARAARLSLGGVDQALERHRDSRSLSWLEDLRQDLGHAWRGLRRAPLFAAAAITTLALGVGATSAIAVVLHTLLMKPLAYAVEPERLVRLVRSTPNARNPAAPPIDAPVFVTPADAAALMAAGTRFDGVGLWAPTVVGLTGVENAGHLSVARLSAATLDLLGVRPLLGRPFAPEDDTSATTVALLSHGVWQRLFASDPAVIGRTVTVQTVLGRRRSHPVVVIGVMPPAFTFPTADTGLWTNLGGLAAGAQPPRGGLLLRLVPGAEPAAAVAEIDGVVRERLDLPAEARLSLVREQDHLVTPVRRAIVVLGAAVVALLLIACLNVANLLLARTLARSRELSVRAALGATSSRLARQCLTDSLVLGAIGGIGGVAVAAGALAAFRRLATSLPRIDLGTVGAGWGGGPFPRLDELRLDATALPLTVAAALVIGVAVGLAAAWRAARTDVFGATRAVGASARLGAGAATARRALVVTQVAAAMTLLVGAVLLTRSLQHLLTTDPGYERTGVLTFQVVLPTADYPDARLLAYAEALAERLRTLPGVAAAAYANQLPMVQLRDTAGGLWDTADPLRQPAPEAPDARFVSADYFAAMGIPVLAGRGFTAGDGTGQPRVLVVNQVLARAHFAGRDPLGALVYVGRDTTPWRVVGVVGDVRQFGLDRAPEPQFFVDLRQWAGGMPLFPTGAYYVVKAPAAPATLVGDIRRLARALDPQAALFNVAGMDAIVTATVARPRLYAVLLGGFAALGVLLAGIGVYGVLAYLVQERTAEIGVRMALGASPATVLGMVLRQGGALVAAGLAIGAAGAVALGRAAAGLLFGVRPLDPTTFVTAAGLFAVVGLAAIAVPARRASRLDPLAALRRD